MAVRIDSVSEGFYRNTSVPSPENITMACWFMYRGTGDGTWEHCLGHNDGTGNQYILLYASSTGTPEFSVHTQSGNGTFGPITQNVWYFCGLSQGTGNLTGFFAPLGATTLTTQLVTGSGSYTAGEISFGTNVIWTEWCNGRWANLMVWQTELTNAELLQQMQSSVPIVGLSNLWAWYPLWEPNYLIDLSGNGRGLSSVGGTPLTEDHPPISWGAPMYTLPAAAGEPSIILPSRHMPRGINRGLLRGIRR